MEFLANIIASLVLFAIAILAVIYGVGIAFFVNIPFDEYPPTPVRVFGVVSGLVLIAIAFFVGYLGYQLQPFEFSLKN